MRIRLFVAVALLPVLVSPSPLPAQGEPARPLRIIAFGAHPDDNELKAAGMAARWAARGHEVKFVAMTNGDIGHFGMAGGPLAMRREAEVEECARILGIETEVLDIHDGELMPSLENRKTVARLIREWQADVVLAHRPYDYHADHRYTGVLINDAAVRSRNLFPPSGRRVTLETTDEDWSALWWVRLDGRGRVVADPVEEPPLFKVLLHNDDFTTMEFVVWILQSVFNMAEQQALQVMLNVHVKGIGVAGVYTYEIAEMKVNRTTELAREQEYPLLCTMERA